MNQSDIARLIGDVLTEIDSTLSDPGLSQSSAQWQTLYALRKHLDDQQREMIRAEFDETTQEVADLSASLQEANRRLETVVSDISRVSNTIETISKIASIMDQLLAIAKI